MSTALQLHSETMSDWQIIRDQAAVLVKSGFLPQSIKTPEQALAIILTGRELGIGTMMALNNINVIQGKPTVPPQLMLALINRTNQLDDMLIETGSEGASVTIKRRGRSAYTARFGPKEAAAMGLSGKDNYKKQPATMYKWRAVADACRVTFSDVLHGMYTPDEMGATTDLETGEIIAEIPEPEPTVYDLRTTSDLRLEMAPEAERKNTPISKGTQEILKLITTLQWSREKLVGWIEEHFNFVIESDDLAGVFDSFGVPEQRGIFAALKKEMPE